MEANGAFKPSHLFSKVFQINLMNFTSSIISIKKRYFQFISIPFKKCISYSVLTEQITTGNSQLLDAECTWYISRCLKSKIFVKT